MPQIDVGGNVANILVGSVALYVAPPASTLPNVDGTYPIVWPVAWKKVGYTDAGVDFSYSPSVKEIKVDEELAAVMYVLDGEKAEISATLAEGTLANLNKAISASTLTAITADVTKGSGELLKFGSGTLNEVMIGFEGYAPPASIGATPLPAVGIAYRAMAQANVKQTFKRADKVLTPLSFSLLADSTKTIGQRLMLLLHITGPHS